MGRRISLIGILSFWLLGLGLFQSISSSEGDGTNGSPTAPESGCDGLSVDFCTDFEGPDNWDCADTDAVTPSPAAGNDDNNCTTSPYANDSQSALEGGYDGSSDDFVYAIEETFDGGQWLKLYHSTNVSNREGGVGTDAVADDGDVQIAACLRIVDESIGNGDTVTLLGNFADPKDDSLTGLELQQNAGVLELHHTDGGDCNQNLVAGDVYEINLFHGDVRSGAAAEDVTVWLNGVELTGCGVSDGDITDQDCSSASEGCWGAKTANTNGATNSNNSYSFSIGLLAIDYANDGSRIDLDCDAAPSPPISVSSVTATPSTCTIGTDCDSTDITVQTSAADGPTCDYRIDCDDSDGTGDSDATAANQVCPSYTLVDVCDYSSAATYTITAEVTDDGDSSTDEGTTTVTAIDATETDPPTPNPATFSSDPTALSYQAIDMTLTTATDASPPVQYRVTLEDDTEVCAWSADPNCTDTGLSESTEYCYEGYYKDSLDNTTSEPTATCETTPAQPSAGTCDSITVTTDAYGLAGPTTVVWTFDQAYECGTYANNHDWWVKPLTGGGTVQITSVTPTASGGRNGLMVNPAPTGLKSTQHAYDDRASGYSSGLNRSLPYSAPAGTSLVKAVSRASTTCAGSSTRGWIDAYSVLTVVASTPENDGATAFRPPFAATTKTAYSTTSIDFDAIPGLDPALYGTHNYSHDDIVEVFASTSGSYVAWASQAQHIASCLALGGYNGGYGGYSTVYTNPRLIELIFGARDSTKDQAVINVVQHGIDVIGALREGQLFGGGGGQALGPKKYAVLAATLLDDADMKAEILARDGGSSVWTAGAHVYQGEHGDALYGHPNPKNSSGNKTRKDEFEYIDGKQDYWPIQRNEFMLNHVLRENWPAYAAVWDIADGGLFGEFMQRRYDDGLRCSPDIYSGSRAGTMSTTPAEICQGGDGYDAGMTTHIIAVYTTAPEVSDAWADTIGVCAPNCTEE